MKKIGDGIIKEGNDDSEEQKRKEEMEKKLDPREHQFLCVVVGGNRIEVPLKKFLEKYGSPDQYDQESLRKYVLRTYYGL